jgi:lipopolysaccharide export system protein LptC
MRRLALGGLGVVLAALLGLRMAGSGDDSSGATTPDGPALNAYARDIRLTATDARGEVSWAARSPEARQHRDDRAWRLTAPEWQLHTGSANAPWRGVADRGWLGPDHDHARLIGNVVMTRQRPEGPTRLSTSRMVLHLPDRYAETDQRVTLTQPDGRVEAIGARVWLDERRLELLDNVEGVYDAVSD